jgi:hypothetical protein
MITKPIDVWDVETFDGALLARLREAAGLISRYLETDRRQFLEREASSRWFPHPENPYAREYSSLSESLIAPMAQRPIRAWHYARLTDAEVQTIIQEGPVLSDLTGIRCRIDAQVAAGVITAAAAEHLWADSPFHQQEDIRSNRFWMVSHPTRIDDSGVELLLGHWGGEGVYFWQRDPDLVSALKSIGAARIVELHVPLNATNHAFNAARATIATFARSIGCVSECAAFDLYINRPTGPQSVLAVHSKGEDSFEAMACGYPARFVDMRPEH